MKKITRLAALLLLLLSLAACAPAALPTANPTATPAPTPTATEAPAATPAPTPQADTKPLLWEVRDEESGARLWLFGSIHAADALLYPLPEAVEAAYEGSDALAVEMDVLVLSADIARQLAMLSAMRCPEGKTFKDTVSPEAYEEIGSFARERGVYASYLEGYNVYFWASLVSGEATAAAGLDSALGADMYFLSRAHKSGKEILELESFELQLSLLTLGSQELQEATLVSEVRYFGDTVAALRGLYDSYRRGDGEALRSILCEGSDIDVSGLDAETAARLQKELEEYNRAMVDDRNLAMAEKAKNYLASGKEVFLVAGEAHMLGEKGIAELLRGAGYTVKKIDY